MIVSRHSKACMQWIQWLYEFHMVERVSCSDLDDAALGLEINSRKSDVNTTLKNSNLFYKRKKTLLCLSFS